MWRKASLKLVSVAALCAAVLATIGLQVANASSGRSALGGSAAPSRARAHRVGSISASSPVRFELGLKLRNARGAAALVRAVSTPGSASYRHYLTGAQWEARFSPTGAQVAKASRWLRSQGFKVGTVSKDRLSIAASGTASQVERAFDTKLALYRVAGHTVRLASGDLSVPPSLAGTIVGAMGVNQDVAVTAISKSPNYPPPPAVLPIAKPCGKYYAAESTKVKPPFGHGYPKTMPDVVCGYKPAQFRSAYGVKSSNTGKGYRVAIVDAYDSRTIVSDSTTFFKRNDPGNPFSRADFTAIDHAPFTNQSLCAASGWLTEQAIDVTAVHAMATHAHIVFEGAKSCLNQDLYAADDDAVAKDRADVVTNSWGDPAGDVFDSPSDRAMFDDMFMEAAGKGITMLYSTGDDGDNFDVTGISAPGYPASSPYVTGVGGTTTKINASGKRTGDLGWATGRAFFCASNGVNILPGCTKKTLGHWVPAAADGESGGYTSYVYTQPKYQKGIVPTALAQRNSPILGPVSMRVIPDISLDADPGTGELIGYTQTFPNGTKKYAQTRYGGTSLASPLLAGVVADIDQAAGSTMGFINPRLYEIDKTTPSAIYDVLAEKGKQGNYRRDYTSAIVPGYNKGFFRQVRELYYPGPEVYCDGVGNCASRPNTLSAAKGFDSLTGMGSPGRNFIAVIAKGS